MVAKDWNVSGTIRDNGKRINWSNGTYWLNSESETSVNLSGDWRAYERNGSFIAPAHIKQEGKKLTFLDIGKEGTLAKPRNKSGGTFLNTNKVEASEWGVTGEINGNRINWSNGTYWLR